MSALLVCWVSAHPSDGSECQTAHLLQDMALQSHSAGRPQQALLDVQLHWCVSQYSRLASILSPALQVLSRKSNTSTAGGGWLP